MDAIKRIMTYLEKLCQSDENLAMKMSSQPLKTPEKMMVYIEKQAKELAKSSSSICVEDSEVYKWARHYWNDYEEKEEKTKPTAKVKVVKEIEDDDCSLFDSVETPKKEKCAKPKKQEKEYLNLFDFIN